MIFQNAFVVVAPRNLIIHGDKEGIIDAGVLEIVQGCRY